MRKESVRRPTDAELAILRVLWDRGPATVKQVHEVLNRTRRTGHTTILKQMQVMTEKGLLVRDESRRPHLYRPAFEREHTQRRLVEYLVDKAFGGSARKLVMQALRGEDLTPQELRRVERLLDELQGDDK